jgi:hypothetical protein
VNGTTYTTATATDGQDDRGRFKGFICGVGFL